VRSALAVACCAALAGCGRAAPVEDAAVPADDLAVPTPPAGDGGAGAIFAGVAFSGCDDVEQPDGGPPRCTGSAPLSLTLVALGPDGVTSWYWTLPGASPSSSPHPTPTATWPLPGRYGISLVVGGPQGQASAAAEVRVLAVGTGAACSDDRQCAVDAGARCLCEGDGGCPGALAPGLCTRDCTGGGCAPGELCVDLSRAASGDPPDGGSWRRAICLPACAVDADCRAGFACRDLPALATGEPAGGRYEWRPGCFAPVLAADGAPCVDAAGRLAPTGCLGGLCVALGARGLCSSPCDSLPCPSPTVCATFAFAPARPFCLPRCDAQHPCGDPLLACSLPGGPGAYGFTVPTSEPIGATYCAPRRCAADSDCAPAGHCAVPDAGPDAGSCTP